MTNYEINKKNILKDYYKCIGSFLNCYVLYNKLENVEKINEDEEEELIKQGMEEDLLSNLGKVGEKAFKYIIGLENIHLHPNQDVNTFESLWKKTSTLKEFAKKHGINEKNEDFIKLLNYYDENNQKAHNFDYWFSVIDILMKNTSDKFKKFMEYTIQSEMLIEYCKSNNNFSYVIINDENIMREISFPFRTAIFPYLLEMEYDFLPSVSSIQLEQIMKTKREAIKKNGDIFTRLRYASNNEKEQKFNLKEVYQIIKNIIIFIKMIHEANDDLNFDLIKSYGKYKSLEFSSYLKIPEEEITKLFSLDMTGIELSLTLYENNYSYSSIKKLLEIGVPKEDLRKVMREKLQAGIVANFFKQGIKDYEKMRQLVDYYNEFGEYSYQKK